MTVTDVVTGAVVHGGKELPVKRERVELHAAWLIRTAKFAMDRGISFTVDSQGRVYGYTGSANAMVNFPVDDEGREWVKEMLEFSPRGVCFPMNYAASVSGGGVRKAMRPYANFPVDGSVGYIDHTNGVVHLKRKGTHIKSVYLEVNRFQREIDAYDFEDGLSLDFSEAISPEMAKALTGAVCTDPTRQALQRIGANKYGKREYMFATNGRLLVGCYVEGLPAHFTIDPKMVKLRDLVDYRIATGKNSVRQYSTVDGLVVVERDELVPPNASIVVDEALSTNDPVTMNAEDFGELMKEVAHLGLGLGDQTGGTIVFQKGCAEVVSDGATVAVIEKEIDLEEGVKAVFNVPYTTMMANAGFDFTITEPTAPAVCRNDAGFGIVMPLRPS